MNIKKNEYIIISKISGKDHAEVEHRYWVGEGEDIKTIQGGIKEQELNEEQFSEYDNNVKLSSDIIKEIKDICKQHEERLTSKNNINSLETKITVSHNQK